MTVMIFVTDFIERCERSHLAGRAEYVFEPARQLNLVDLAGSRAAEEDPSYRYQTEGGSVAPSFLQLRKLQFMLCVGDGGWSVLFEMLLGLTSRDTSFERCERFWSPRGWLYS